MKGLKISFKKSKPHEEEPEELKTNYVEKPKDDRVKEMYSSTNSKYDFAKKNETKNQLENLEDLKREAKSAWGYFQKGDTLRSRNINTSISQFLTDKLAKFDYSKKSGGGNSQYQKDVTSTGLYLDKHDSGDDGPEDEEDIANEFLGYTKQSLEEKLKIEELKKLAQEAKKAKAGLQQESEDFLKKTKYMVSKDELYDQEYDETWQVAPKKKLKTEDDDSDDDKPKFSKKERDYQMRVKRRQDKGQKLTERHLARCQFCLSNSQLKDEEVLSVSNRAYIIQPKKTSFFGKHFIIAPFNHCVSIREAPEEDYQEVRNYLKSMIQCFDKFDKSLLFIETAYGFDKSPHGRIEAFVIRNKDFKTAPSYFTKEINDMDGDWSTHRKIIYIKKDKGGLRKQIPENFPYFFVDFGLDDGMAHIIEKEKEFDRKILYEIVATIMGKDMLESKSAKTVSRDELFRNKRNFIKEFEEFDWAETLK